MTQTGHLSKIRKIPSSVPDRTSSTCRSVEFEEMTFQPPNFLLKSCSKDRFLKKKMYSGSTAISKKF